jgi:hypothetical protein
MNKRGKRCRTGKEELSIDADGVVEDNCFSGAELPHHA